MPPYFLANGAVAVVIPNNNPAVVAHARRAFICDSPFWGAAG
jgi:hypothetical protein